MTTSLRAALVNTHSAGLLYLLGPHQVPTTRLKISDSDQCMFHYC